MGEMEETVKFSDLSKYEQKVVEGYSSLVKELFLIKSETDPDDYEEGINSREFNKEIKNFLETVIAIFSITHKTLSLSSSSPSLSSPSLSSQNPDEENVDDKILKQCIGKFRSAFRKQFRGVHYLTKERFEKCRESVSRIDIPNAFNSLVSMHGITDQDREKLSSSLTGQVAKEVDWIQKVNQFKKMKILDSIKAEILDDFKRDIEMEFARLYNGSATDFYEEQELAIKYTEHLVNAVDSFEQQIPFEEEEQVLLEMTTTFDKELRKDVIENLVQKNSSNKATARLILEAKVNRSIATYEENMSAFVDNAPLQQPTIFLEHHEKLKVELVPIHCKKSKVENAGYEELQVEYLNLYHKRIQQNFSKQLETGRQKALNNLLKYHAKAKNISKRYVREMQQCFDEFKISKDYAEKLLKKIERDVMETTQEMKDSSVGNPKNIEILLAKSKPKTNLTKAEQAEQEAEIGRIMKKMKQKYTDQMKLHGKSYPLIALKLEIIKLFQMEIRTKVGGDHPCEKYVETLRNFMDKELENFDQHTASILSQQPQPPNPLTSTSVLSQPYRNPHVMLIRQPSTQQTRASLSTTAGSVPKNSRGKQSTMPQNTSSNTWTAGPMFPRIEFSD